MKVSLYKSKSDKVSIDVLKQLEKLCEKYNINVSEEDPNIVISIGGDGTLLSAVQKYAHRLDKISFVGVHTGNLGFYTDWKIDQLEDLLSSLVKHQGDEVSYPMIDVTCTDINDNSYDYLVLNESTFKSTFATLVADVLIGDQFFEHFRGDGLCISTPTGSTAYNKSLGGAIIHPNLEVLQMSEISSINNRLFRTVGTSLILAPNETITIIPRDQNGHYSIGVDGKAVHDILIQKIEYRISKSKVRFLKYKHTGFWNRVRNSFIENINEI